MGVETRQAANAIYAWTRVMQVMTLDETSRVVALAAIERNARVLLERLAAARTVS